ncbi:MAG TPA: type IV pilin [Thermoplasmata archaeon]|nr:type IV pilin [Thermoplasmata archaeon]
MRARRAVSDVVATILLLGLTVTLFASIFFFVNNLPPPPAQSQNQFGANLLYSGNLITTVQVTHLAGPITPGTAQVYITSAANPKNDPPVFTVSQGLGGAGSWALGQVWTKNISSYGLTIPDNLTISIVSQSVLLYRNTLPGSNPNAPPNFVSVGYTPQGPAIGSSFTIFTQIIDKNLKANSVYVNISQISGGVGRFPMTYSASTGLWTYIVPGGVTTSAGTFFVFINASDSSGLVNSVTLPVTIEPSLGLLSIQLAVTPTLIVAGSSVSVVAIVSNLAAGSSNMTVTFTVAGTTISTQSGVVAAGSNSAFSTTWNPSAVGTYTILASVTAAGGASASASLNDTVFPKILLLAHNVPSGTLGPDNTSAWLATELTAAGIPYSSAFVSCKSALTSAMFSSYAMAIVDFGATWTGGCPKGASTTDQGAITGASSTAMWVVGSNAFAATTCTSYTSAFFAKIGASWSGSGTCGTLPNATGTLTYTSAPASGLRGDGIPGTIGINRTLAGVSTYVPYNYLTRGAIASGGGAYAKVGSNVVGTYSTSSPVGASLDTEPALLTATLPNSNTWGTGIAGEAVVYNVVGYLCGLSTSTATGRALSDFGVGQATLVGQSHAALSSVYVGIRANGPSAGSVTVTLLVNGAVALFGGAPVTASGVVSANGAFIYLTLTWQAPAAGTYALSVSLAVSGSPDYNTGDSQLGLSVVNQPITFA